MNRSPLSRILLPALLCAALFAGLSGASAKDSAAAPASIAVRDGWVRWLPGDLPAAGYLTLRNDSDRARVLQRISSPDYAAVELHESFRTPDGAARMRPVAALPVPARGHVTLAPGGYHLMLMKPRRSLHPGDTVTLTFHFEDGGSITGSLALKPPGHTE